MSPTGPVATDIAAQANVGFRGNCGSSRRSLEMTLRTGRPGSSRSIQSRSSSATPPARRSAISISRTNPKAALAVVSISAARRQSLKPLREVARLFSTACRGIPADYIENARRTVLFTRSANIAIERVFVLNMVSRVLVLFDAGEIDHLLF